MAELVAGGAVGLAFSVLYEAAKDVVKKTKLFKSLFKQLDSKLRSLKPLLKDIAKYNKLLDRPEEEQLNFEVQMTLGAKLIPKCLEVGRLNLYKKYKYTSKLQDLDTCLNDLISILSVEGVVDGKEALYTVRKIEQMLVKGQKQGNVVAQKQLEFKDLCAVPELPPVEVVGFDGPVRELKKMILEDGVSKLVLTAHGGSGKTTLATKLCHDKEVIDKFKENIIFVIVARRPNLEVLQELCQRMESQAPTFQSESDAFVWLQKFLKEAGDHHRLLVLDDVWPRSKSLLQKFSELNVPNNKIMVTSRSKLPEFGTPYHLESLNYEFSKTLFHHWASLGNRSPSIPDDILNEILDHCQGCPLAIKVIGTSLRGKDIPFWRKRAMELSKSSILDSETELLLSLQSSLDALEGDDAIIKDYFMDLGSFPEDQRIPVAAFIDIWAELYDLNEDFLPITNLLELTTRSLADLVVTREEKMEIADDYYAESFVTQHDLLRELAIYSSKLEPLAQRKRLIVDINGDGEPKWLTEQKSQPINARLLSITSDEELSTKWNNIQLPEVEVLILNFQANGYALPDFVGKMVKLKAVIITNYGATPAELSNFQVLGSLPNLKRIRLERISIPCMTENAVPLKSLKKISLFMCKIGQDFCNGTIKISDAIPKLEELNIDYCDDLVELPAELSDLIWLRKLSITNCHKLRALPQEIGNLVKLILLRLRSCTDLAMLPASIKNLTMLDALDISDCIGIKELPEEFGEISSLRRINMRHCLRLQELPLSVFELEKLEEVMCDEYTEYLWGPFLPSLNIRMEATPQASSLRPFLLLNV